ncbi:unnamed protein product [Amoebophrya sp. A25]|nr:unnamed protein product [Amoebophrya sp. A25]|eukprot:GSA25T00000596001.1
MEGPMQVEEASGTGVDRPIASGMSGDIKDVPSADDQQPNVPDTTGGARATSSSSGTAKAPASKKSAAKAKSGAAAAMKKKQAPKNAGGPKKAASADGVASSDKVPVRKRDQKQKEVVDTTSNATASEGVTVAEKTISIHVEEHGEDEEPQKSNVALTANKGPNEPSATSSSAAREDHRAAAEISSKKKSKIKELAHRPPPVFDARALPVLRLDKQNLTLSPNHVNLATSNPSSSSSSFAQQQAQVTMYGQLPSFPDEDIILGIDEAGRGPVLGPMVYGLAYAPETADLQSLIASELDDSKKLTITQRADMFEAVRAKVGWIAHISSADRLSRDMTGATRVSLNLIAQNATTAMIREVLAAPNVARKVRGLYVDTVGDPERYTRVLKDLFPQIPTIIVAKKADSLYKIVSAASVVAKVVRDGLLEDFQFPERNVEIVTRDFGCGYPGDKATIRWMEKNMQHVFGFPRLVRFSWETTAKMMEKNCANVDFHEEEDPTAKESSTASAKQLPITAYFAKVAQPPRKSAFLMRGLNIVTTNQW